VDGSKRTLRAPVLINKLFQVLDTEAVAMPARRLVARPAGHRTLRATQRGA